MHTFPQKKDVISSWLHYWNIGNEVFSIQHAVNMNMSPSVHSHKINFSPTISPPCWCFSLNLLTCLLIGHEVETKVLHVIQLFSES